MLDKSAASVALQRCWMGREACRSDLYREWTYDPLPEAIHLGPSYSVA